MRPRAAVAIACAALLAIPASAQGAGTVTIAETRVLFVAAMGVANDVTVVTSAGSVTVSDTADVIDEAEAGCVGTGTNTVTCTVPGATLALAGLEDMNDRIQTSGVVPQIADGGTGDDDLTVLNDQPAGSFANSVDGQDGNDRIITGDGGDVVSGGAGTDSIATGGGRDSVTGGEGDGDSVDAGPGNDSVGVGAGDGAGDTYAGGPGLDKLFASGPSAPPVDLVLDLAAGTIGGTNTASAAVTGFEDADLFGHATTNVRGTPASNSISTFFSSDTVDPGAGSDFLTLRQGADRALVRDGFADFVNCGEGDDSAEVDQLDTVSGCESVVVAQVRPVAAELGPPGCAIASVRARIARKALLRRGLRGAVECARPASLEVRLLAGAARRGGGIGVARAGDVVLAERSLPLAGGRRVVRLRVIKRLRAAVPRTARLRLQVVARDEFGNVQIVTRRLRVTSPRPRSR